MDNAREPEYTQAHVESLVQTPIRFGVLLEQLNSDPEVTAVCLLADDADLVAVAMRLSVKEVGQKNPVAVMVDERVIRRVITAMCPNEDAPEWAACAHTLLYSDRTLVLRDISVIWVKPVFVAQFV